MPTKAALALALDRVWYIDRAFALAKLEALDAIPGDLMLRTPGLEVYVEEKKQASVDAFAVGAYQPRNSDARPYGIVDGVALIEMSGPLLESVPSMAEGTSTIMARREIRMATSDDRVKEIVLFINSPGGQCAGTGALADDVKAAGERKQTVAYLSSICASAAYYVASQCRAIVASPYSVVGSIGVFGVVVDASKQAEMLGLEVHLVTSGGVKGKGALGLPIDDDLLAEYQREVDARMGEFVKAVATGRGMDESRVRELGTGRSWSAKDALSLGLIDAIGTEDDVLSGLIGARAPGS